MKLTGNIRFRAKSRWLRAPVLVLQVEYNGSQTYSEGGRIETEDFVSWRDARVEDLSSIVKNMKAA